MSKLNSKLYKSKMSEENKKSSDNLNIIYSEQIQVMHSPEVELNEIFVSNIYNGNGLAPSDIPPDTKNTTRGVHNFRILKIL